MSTLRLISFGAPDKDGNRCGLAYSHCYDCANGRPCHGEPDRCVCRGCATAKAVEDGARLVIERIRALRESAERVDFAEMKAAFGWLAEKLESELADEVLRMRKS